MASQGDDYRLLRDDKASVRLCAQHSILRKRVCKLPDLEALIREVSGHQHPARIADIGCGNGLLALQVATTFHATVEVVGLDISDELLPSVGTRPANCTFETFDIRAPLATRFVASFDIVHVRLLAAGLGDRDGPTVVQNLRLMLKPGGKLHWTDIGPPFVLAYEKVGVWKAPGIPIEHELRRVTPSLAWLGDLPALLTREDFTEVQTEELRPVSAFAGFESFNFISALEEIGERRSQLDPTDVDFGSAVQKAREYTSQRGPITVALHTVLATKPNH